MRSSTAPGQRAALVLAGIAAGLTAARCGLNRGGTAVGGCAQGQSLCGGECVDTGTDPDHCGACGRACRGGATCAAGQCQEGGGGGGAAGGASSGGAGGGAACEGTAAAGCLSDEGLIARYFLDEAASGQAPMRAQDAAASPLDLDVTYAPELGFAEEGSHRGLSWTEAGKDSRASIPIDGTKIKTRLHGSMTGTIEIVLDVRAVAENRSRLVHVGSNSESGRFTLLSPSLGQVEFWWQGEQCAGTWDVEPMKRTVVHLVLDTTAAAARDRARLYVDGAHAAPSAEVDGFCAEHRVPPDPDRAIDLGDVCHFVLGNREIGQRSFVGTLYYAALYATALTEAQVTRHAGLLRASDDAPRQ